ncbi:MAG: GTPase ObgE [Halanaerobiales bacterium]|nr:GTPase ObgE [Halanaerobiales bacterium]
MFVDEAVFKVKSGNGGNGVVSFRREKFEAMGGPDGGDGGNGGDIILEVDEGLNTLADFKYKNIYKAENGSHGRGKDQRGRDGKDLYLAVPPGTLVYNDDNNQLLADLKKDEQQYVVAKGGKGGRGNARFKKSTRKAPKFAENGEKGEELKIRLELQLLADVGLVGYPNVGKSTLISKVSAAKPEIASYHFTTLKPNLGVVSYGEYKSYVMADIPGIIEGAHLGVGLGYEFLKHLERTRLLVHIIDVSGIEGRDPIKDFEKINMELKEYKTELFNLPQIVVLNKIDLKEARDNLDEVKNELENRGYEVYPISAVTGQGVDYLKYRIGQKLEELPKKDREIKAKDNVLIKPEFEKDNEMFIKQLTENKYEIKGKLIEELLEKTDFNNDASVQRLLRIVRHHQLDKKMRKKGIKDGDIVLIGPIEFEYIQ